MTFVVVVVFLPLAISGGLIGNLLKEFAIPIIAATLTSLLVSFTVTPLLMSRFGKLSDDTRPTLSARFSRFIEKTFESLKNGYARILSFGLKHKIVILSATIALLISSFFLFPMGLIGFAFMPEVDQGEFRVTLDMNPQVTVYQNNQTTMQVEKMLLSKPEVQRVYTNVGSTGSSVASNSINNATTISVKMVDKKDRNSSVDAFAQQIKQEIMTIPGIRARVSLIGIAGSAGREQIQLIVQGADYEKIEETAALLMEAVKKTPGTADVKLSIDDPKQEVQVKLNREKMSQLGLASSDVGAALRVALAGNDDAKFTDGNYEYNIRVGVDNFDKTNVEDVAKLTLLNKRGELIELNQIADISYGLGPSMLERTNRISSITVKSNVVGRPSGTVGNEIMAAIDGKIPEGVTVRAGGMMEQQSKAFGSLGIAFLAAIVLIYLIMVVLYNSLSDPLVVLISIPLSFIGALLALGLTLNSLSIFSIIGLIVLIGLVAKNAILLVDFTNQIRLEQNMDTFHALIAAGKERLRPILMTSVSTILGMLPIALATGNGAELKNGMAWVIIGGLTSSMLLTLIVVPVVYYCVDRIKVRFTKTNFYFSCRVEKLYLSLRRYF
jgi:HAE1 family hydrophobic/amphiphilic exporter-1